MRTFLSAACTVFLALAPAAIATTREDIEERKRAHAEMLERVGHDMHRRLKELDEDGRSPHVTNGTMRKIRRDQFEKKGREPRSGREMPDASEMHRVAQDFAEQHRKRAADVRGDHEAAQKLLRAHASQRPLSGLDEAADHRAHFAEKTKKMQKAARDFAHGLSADRGGGRDGRYSAMDDAELAGRGFDHATFQNLGSHLEESYRRGEEPADFENQIEDESAPGSEGGD